MSLQYLLDGYNVLNQLEIPDTAYKLEDQRSFLIKFLTAGKFKGSARNQLTVVFDGKSGVGGSGEAYPEISVKFSKDEPADDLIKRIVENAASKKSIVVVSDDRDIQYAVRALGARSQGVQEFLGKDKSKKRKAAAEPRLDRPQRGSKQISHSAEQEINSELQKIWVKKKKR